MVRTANTARKQVTRVPASQSSTKEDSRVAENGQTSHRSAEKRPAKSLSVPVPKISQMPKPTPKKASKNVMREIRYYQSNIGFLIPRALIVRMVRYIFMSVLKTKPNEEFRFTAVSLNVLHECIENHVVCLLELSYMAARHAKRVTLFPTDIRLINRIKGAGSQ